MSNHGVRVDDTGDSLDGDPTAWPFGPDTVAIVDDDEAGVIAYVHAELAEEFASAWRAHKRDDRER